MLDFLAAGVEGFYRPGSMVFDWVYFPGQGDWLTARLHMTAITLAGQHYSNDYLLFYELEDGQIARVTEMFDTAPLRNLADQALDP
jgi:ketosteroid isomerase-like protein